MQLLVNSIKLALCNEMYIMCIAFIQGATNVVRNVR